MLVDRGDLDAIHSVIESESVSSTDLMKDVKMLHAKVERLEQAVDILFSANSMSASRFAKMSTAQLVQLHDTVKRDLQLELLPTDRMLSYCEIFIRITEEDVDRMNGALQITDAWRPFYELLVKLAQIVAGDPDYDTDIELQHIYELLSFGRSNLRSVAAFFISKSNDTKPIKELLARSASNDIDIFDDLAGVLKSNKSALRSIKK